MSTSSGISKQVPFSLPVLETIRIASPCTADWNAMSGDDRVRFCGECSKQVFNLSEMTRDEAQKLLAEQTGRTCVRLYKRPDGTVLTADCPVGLARVRQRMRRMVLAGLAMAGTLFWGSLTALGWSIGREKVANGTAAEGVFSKWFGSERGNFNVVQGGAPAPPAMMGKMVMGDVCIDPPVLVPEPEPPPVNDVQP